MDVIHRGDAFTYVMGSDEECTYVVDNRTGRRIAFPKRERESMGSGSGLSYILNGYTPDDNFEIEDEGAFAHFINMGEQDNDIDNGC